MSVVQYQPSSTACGVVRLSERSVSMALVETHRGPGSSAPDLSNSVTQPCMGRGRVSTRRKFPSIPGKGTKAAMKVSA